MRTPVASPPIQINVGSVKSGRLSDQDTPSFTEAESIITAVGPK